MADLVTSPADCVLVPGPRLRALPQAKQSSRLQLGSACSSFYAMIPPPQSYEVRRDVRSVETRSPPLRKISARRSSHSAGVQCGLCKVPPLSLYDMDKKGTRTIEEIIMKMCKVMTALLRERKRAPMRTRPEVAAAAGRVALGQCTGAR
jgi:hypothetical protein